MTDLLYDFITTGVDLLLVGGILAAMIVMMQNSSKLTAIINEQQAVTKEFDYYMEYHTYDNRTSTEPLAAADALSAIVQYRYEMYIFIQDGSTYFYNNPKTGRYYKVSSAIDMSKSVDDLMALGGEELTYEKLHEALRSDKKYESNILELNYDRKLIELDGKSDDKVFTRNTVVIGVKFNSI